MEVKCRSLISALKTSCQTWILSDYCRFGNFRENFIFANSIKRHISDVNNLRLRQNLPISINDRVILPFREVLFSRNFAYAYAKFRENKVLAKISEFTVLATLLQSFVSVHVILFAGVTRTVFMKLFQFDA